ncbi:hypothetical protein BX666DRAFT_1991625 [Dichotomocladium elegans]|nr:hypothetical protein BX666DRAFT_1991625 [Dichotomocladium elegans]
MPIFGSICYSSMAMLLSVSLANHVQVSCVAIAGSVWVTVHARHFAFIIRNASFLADKLGCKKIVGHHGIINSRFFLNVSMAAYIMHVGCIGRDSYFCRDIVCWYIENELIH